MNGTFETEIETDAGEILKIGAEASFSVPVPATWHHPAEGGELLSMTVKVNGQDMSEDALAKLAGKRTVKWLEAKLFEAALRDYNDPGNRYC